MNDAALVESQRTERAGTEAAPVGDQTELDFLNGGNTPCLGIAGVPGPLIGQGIDCVHFFCGQRLLGRILDHELFSTLFCQTLGRKGVAVSVLDFERLRVFTLIGLQFLIAGKDNGGQALVQLGTFEHRAVNVSDVFHIQAGI